MSNHLHLIASVKELYQFPEVLRDFKKFTNKAILKAIVDLPESRREWMLDKFSFEAKCTKRAKSDSIHVDLCKRWELDYGLMFQIA